MPRGGARPGAGRKKGQTGKQTKARINKAKAAAAAIEALLPESFKGDAHALMMAVYKDPSHPIALRLEAAKAAAPYEKPALARIESHNEHVVHKVIASEPLTQDEWAAQHTTAH